MSKFKFFWDTMKKCDWSTEGDGDDNKILKPVVDYLASLDDDKIFSFEELMTKLLYDLDTEQLFKDYAKVDEYASDDCFLYARCVALINGENYYEDVKSGANKKAWSMEFESLLYVAKNAWGQKHNKDSGDFPNKCSISYETGSNDAGWCNKEERYCTMIQQLSKALSKQKSMKYHAIDLLKGATIKGSKLGGCPYVPIDTQIPTNAKGEPLIMIAQLNLSEISPSVFPLKKGILQFWIGNDTHYGADFKNPCSQENSRVLYYPNEEKCLSKKDVLELFSSIDLEGDLMFPLQKPFTNEFKFRIKKSDTIRMNSQDINFSKNLVEKYNELYPDEPITDVFDDIIYPAEDYKSSFLKVDEFLNPRFLFTCPAKLLGYPDFIQQDPRKNASAELQEYILLFQLQSYNFKGGQLNWGKEGIARWFIHPKDLKKGDFSKVWYSWDC